MHLYSLVIISRLDAVIPPQTYHAMVEGQIPIVTKDLISCDNPLVIKHGTLTSAINRLSQENQESMVNFHMFDDQRVKSPGKT